MSRTQQLLALLERRPLLCDGAMGTQLQLLGLAAGDCGVRWNVDAPEAVRSVHQKYAEAGADLLTTNTFSGNELTLAAHGLGARAAEFSIAGARLARAVAGDTAFVLGNIGPFGGLLEPYGDTAPDTVARAFRDQAAALLEGGADAILIETMTDAAEAVLAIGAARSAGARCVMVTFAFQKTSIGTRTMMGNDVPGAVRVAVDAGADLVGANCGTELSLEDYDQLVRELIAAAGTRPVIVQPNAGSPILNNGHVTYDTSPARFAAAANRYRAAGARIIGGCCGTTPAHIAAMKEAS